MKTISLAGSEDFALVDDQDFEWLSHWEWRVLRCKADLKYARRYEHVEGKRKAILMHRQILGLTERHRLTDHQDHNGLNNQRYNIREATSEQNNYNLPRHRNSLSRFKGVSWAKQNKKWQAQISSRSTGHICIGHFDKEEDAAKAYDAAAMEYHGEFACLNFPSGA